MKKLVELDLQSHLSDKTSRMRKTFMKPNAKRFMQMFYKSLLKNDACIVAKDGNKLAGDIAYYVDKTNKRGKCAAIFVADEYKGRGLSLILYKWMLADFKKKKLDHYIGQTTTSGVLATAKKIGRKKFKSVYLVKI